MTDTTSTPSIKERYTLPPLPYRVSELEPWMSAETVILHHDRHHAAYVAGANQALAQLATARANHDWGTINQLEADLAVAIDASFGEFDTFREQFTRAALGVQGSGWAALAWEPVGRCLVIEQIHDHQSTIAQGSNLLLVCDVWEHAYYLQYRNARADWLDAFWHIVNWADVEQRLVGTGLHDDYAHEPLTWPAAVQETTP